MSDKAILTLVIVLFGGGALAVAAYYIARLMRGKIKLSMPRTTFNPGDTISGNLDLQTKKAIEGNKLIVSLIGQQVTKTFKEGKSGGHSRTTEVYRDEVLLEESKSYPAGFTSTHPFEISAPDMNTPEFLNSTAGQALTMAYRLFSNRSTRFKWKVEGRLDAKGIDLAASKPVVININTL